MNEATNRRIFITGGGSGIGAAAARLFASNGATVVIADRMADAAQNVAREIGGLALHLDVSNETAVKGAITEVSDRLGGLDGLVNAAGITNLERVEGTTLDQWNKQIDVNLTGTFLVCREALELLRVGNAPTIVNVASASGLMPSFAGAAYSVSKAGVIMLTKMLARELGPVVRANAVCPGIVNTPMLTETVPQRNAAFEGKLQSDYALQRVAEPLEIGRLIYFLSSSQSSFMTGTAVAVDGGRTYH